MEVLRNIYPDRADVLHRYDDAHCPLDEQEGQPHLSSDEADQLVEQGEAVRCPRCLGG